MSFEDGSTLIVNPLAALGLLDRIKMLKAKAAIQTGASSTVGKQLVGLCHDENIPLINIVRSE